MWEKMRMEIESFKFGIIFKLFLFFIPMITAINKVEITEVEVDNNCNEDHHDEDYDYYSHDKNK